MSRKKVLLVDDSATTLMMERMLLKSSPYELLTARDGEEAVRVAVAERPDVILMDVMMPKMNGYDACRQLRSHAETRFTPVIMLTTKGEASNVARGFDSGATDYLTKPIDGPEFLRKVRSHLGDLP